MTQAKLTEVPANSEFIMAGCGQDSDSSPESSAEEYLCDYEKKRLENIKKNHELLRSLGEPTPF